MNYSDYKISIQELVDGLSIVSADLEPEFIRLATKVLESARHQGINNVPRAAFFLANCAHESDGFMRMEENLNYTAKRLMQVWPSRFKSLSRAKKYARNPQSLANYVYNGRMGNRPGSNDGWDFRGSGFIQLTGRNNFEASAKRTGLYYDVDPDSLRNDKHDALVSAVDYFVSRRYKGKSLLEWADMLSHKMVCRAINGGLHGLEDRMEKTRLLLSIFLQDEGIYSLPIAKVGSRGPYVKPIQYKLKLLGYDVYKIDGFYGRKTELAVKNFQAYNGLTCDGIVGGNTLTRLNVEIMKRDMNQ